jgi:hypothetical protein
MTAVATKELSEYQLDILKVLEHDGPTKAFLFNDEDLDPLFKMRPRLIRIIPGHVEAVVDITGDGIKKLRAYGR